MNDSHKPDWDPRSETVHRDQRAAYDEMRGRCPVAYSDYLGWSLFRHEDVVRALNDPETFSNAASTHLSVPNGMDPPEHTEYRRIIEPYFEPERMEAFEPVCREIATDLAQSLLERDEVEFIVNFGPAVRGAGPTRFSRLAAGHARAAAPVDPEEPSGDACPGSHGHGRCRPQVRGVCR